MQGKQQAQKSRRADWLMRLYAKPDLEKTVWQVTRDIHVHRRDAEHARSSSRSQMGSAQTCRKRIITPIPFILYPFIMR